MLEVGDECENDSGIPMLEDIVCKIFPISDREGFTKSRASAPSMQDLFSVKLKASTRSEARVV